MKRRMAKAPEAQMTEPGRRRTRPLRGPFHRIPSPSGQRRECLVCHAQKLSSDFSKSQWRRPASGGLPRCKGCLRPAGRTSSYGTPGALPSDRRAGKISSGDIAAYRKIMRGRGDSHARVFMSAARLASSDMGNWRDASDDERRPPSSDTIYTRSERAVIDSVRTASSSFQGRS